MDNSELVVASVTALVVFEMWKAYENNAPTLTELRHGDADDLSLRQRLQDANLSTFTIGFALGAIFSYKTNDPLPLALIIFVLGSLSWWRREILEAQSPK